MSEIAVLVAGGAGFIGAHTCKLLSANGFKPITLDNLSTGYEKAVLYGPFIKGDLREADIIKAMVKKYDIKAAIHFAAFSLVGESVTNPKKYYDNNVSAAIDFADALISMGVDKLVFSSTAAVYGNPTQDLIDEEHSKLPINPYGSTKLAFEGALKWLDAAHGLKHVILRYFNAAGSDFDVEIGESHEPESHLIPLICKAALGTGKPLSVFGTDYDTPDGTAIRDYIHVNDLASAHIEAIKYLLNGGQSDVFNVGTGKGVSVKQAITSAQKLFKEVPHTYAPRREGDPPILVADSKKIMNKFDWKPQFSDIDTIIKTAKAWQENRRY